MASLGQISLVGLGAAGAFGIDPSGAEFEISHRDTFASDNDMKHYVWRIRAGDRIYVLGEFVPDAGVSSQGADLMGRIRQPQSSGQVYLISDKLPEKLKAELEERGRIL